MVTAILKKVKIIETISYDSCFSGMFLRPPLFVPFVKQDRHIAFSARGKLRILIFSHEC